MCDAVVTPSNPWKDTSTCIAWRAGSSTIVAKPVPGDPVGGTSLEPMRLATKVIGVARVAEAGSTNEAIRTNASETCFILGLLLLVKRFPIYGRRGLRPFYADPPESMMQPNSIPGA